MDVVRVGVVGTSAFTEAVHLGSLASHPDARLVALCGRRREHTEEVAARHGSPAVFTDVGTMIDSGLLDAIVVAAPDDQHHPMVLRALDAGLHVLGEKPMARTAAEAREMLTAAESAGVVHMIMFSWRWLGALGLLARLVGEGYLGRCRDAHLVMQADFGEGYDWRHDPALGGGVLTDTGSHLIDLARWLVGDIAAVTVATASHVRRPGPDGEPMAALNDSATLLLEFASGAIGSIDVSAARLVGELPQYAVRLYGDEGSLDAWISVPDGIVAVRGRRRGDQEWSELAIPDDLSGLAGPAPAIWDVPVLAPFTNLAVADRLFVDAVLGRRPAAPTFEDGWRVQQVLDAAQQAQRERRWVDVER